MTFAPSTLQAARRLMVNHLDLHPLSLSYPADLDPNEVGIVGDAAHVATGTSYHLGQDQLRLDAYSRRTARDIAGLSNAASAVDIGQFSVITTRGTFTHRSLAIWMVGQCRTNQPDTRDIREIIYSPDGINVLHYDRERGYASAPTARAPDSHLSHDHFSCYRDAEFRYSLRDLFDRWLDEIGVTDMLLDDVVYTIPATATTPAKNVTVRDCLKLAEVRTGYLANTLGLGGRLDAIAASLAAVRAALPADLAAQLAAILAAAQDDGDMTVVLPAEAVALLDAIRAAITALPDTAEVRDAVADLGEGGAAQVRADA